MPEKKSKYVNVELDKTGERSLLVVKKDLGIGRDAEVMRYLLRQAYNNIPPDRRSAIEKELEERSQNSSNSE